MKKSQANPFLSIKKPWVGGNGNTLYLGIPSNIVKQLQISENSHLMIDLVDDSVIVIKKLNPQFTKSEKDRIQNPTDNSKHESSNTDKLIPEEITSKNDFQNPLDRLDDI